MTDGQWEGVSDSGPNTLCMGPRQKIVRSADHG